MNSDFKIEDVNARRLREQKRLTDMSEVVYDKLKDKFKTYLVKYKFSSASHRDSARIFFKTFPFRSIVIITLREHMVRQHDKTGYGTKVTQAEIKIPDYRLFDLAKDIAKTIRSAATIPTEDIRIVIDDSEFIPFWRHDLFYIFLLGVGFIVTNIVVYLFVFGGVLL